MARLWGIYRTRPPRPRPAISPASTPTSAAEARAPATRRAYAAQWRRFERWCAARALTYDQARELMLAARDRREHALRELLALNSSLR